MSLYTGETGEISKEMRQQIDSKVSEWIEDKRVEFVSGVLFIDNANLLDFECFSFLGRMLESEYAPTIVLSSNRGVSKIRGTKLKSPHGIPMDLL